MGDTVKKYSTLVANAKLDTASKTTVAEQADTWFYELYSSIEALKERVVKLEAENAELKKSQHKDVGQQMSDLFKNNKNTNELHMNIVKKLETHLQQKNKIENNIVVTGLPDKKDEADDTKKVNDILQILKLDPSKVLRKRRIRRNAPAQPSSKNLPELEMIVVEFTDQVTQQTAIANSSFLKSHEDMKKVYINPDRTDAEIRFYRNLRSQRDSLNEKLPELSIEGRHRYDIYKSGSKKGFRFHWGIRNCELVKIFERQETKDEREKKSESPQEDSRAGTSSNI